MREYVVQMVQELYGMGFDEVILADVVHPNTEGMESALVYTAEMSTTPNSVNGICSFAMYAAQQFADRKGVLNYLPNNYSDVSWVFIDTETED